MGSTGGRPSVPLDGLVKAVIGYGGLAMCLTLVFLGMRAVMDIGGACADGGPYVVATSCPEGSTIALLGGIFVGLGCAVLATIGGVAVGGIWAAAPVLAWSALFGSLGWNFLDYGVFNADPQAGIDLGWALCGVMFWIMAVVPLLGIIPAFGAARARGRGAGGGPGGAPGVTVLTGPGQPARGPVVIDTTGGPVTTVSRDGSTITYSSTVIEGDDVPEELREQLEELGVRLAQARRSGQTEASHEELTEIAAGFGAAISAAIAATPLGEAVPPGGTTPRPAGGEPSGPQGGPAGGEADTGGEAGTGADTGADTGAEADAEPDFTEGTQALLDRLERLADMRDRGLLGPEEYEAAKATIMAELEGRS